MKRVAKRALAMLLAVMMLASMVPITVTTASAAEASNAPKEGLSFEPDVLYQMPEIIRPAGSITMEAEVWISPDTTDNTRPGVILGNYSDAANTSGDYGLELHKYGFVRLYVRNADCIFDASTALSGVSADELDIRNYVGTANDPKFVKITVVADTTAHKAILYLNGKKVAEKKQNNLVDGVFAQAIAPHSIGGDIRSGNSCCFKGEIKNFGVYSDIRTDDEIKAYANATSYTNYVDPSDTALVAAFDLAAANALDDLSTADKDLVFTTNAGMTFKKEDPKIYFNKNLTDYPRTYEVEFYAPYETARKSNGVPTGRSGVLFGNWNNTGGQKPTLMLEIHDNGIPKLCMVNDASTSDNYDAKFDTVDVRQNGWVHMVIVNEGFTYHCYINGELVQTVTDTKKNFVPDIEAMQSVYKLSLGKDGRTSSNGNDSSIVFDGIMRNLAFYTEPLTAEQVKASYENGVDTSNESLMLYYDLENSRGKQYVKDLSGNGYDASPDYYERPEEKVVGKDYAYSFAVVGDTQKQVWSDHEKGTTYTSNLYKWIVDNKDEKNIQWVFGVGDITENNGIRNGATMAEWDIAKNAITQLDTAGINYSVILGNHDIITVSGAGGSDYFNQYFGSASGDFYTKRVSGYYQDGKLDNYYMNFEVAGVKYMMLGLEYGANDKILKWASEVVDAHPERRVIVTTHAYMFRDGTTLDKGDVVPPNSSGLTTSETSKNNGDMMWEKFISQHRNILMVLSGHDPYSEIAFRQDRGVNGNLVSQFLVDPQSMAIDLGMVCMLYFSEDGQHVSVEWISTGKTQAAQASDPNAQDILRKSSNQFDFDMYDNYNNFVHSSEMVVDESDETKMVYRIYYTNGTYSEFVINHGQAGEKGDQGDQGIKGDKGDKGDQGDQGIQGEKGEAGTAGIAGNSPYIGTNGNWYIGDVDTGIKAQGDKGDKGDTGVAGAVGEKGDKGDQGDQGAAGTPGADGQDGSIPYIGINGNWYIEGVDTGIKAKGDKGDTGAQGPQGAPGATGPQGLPGTTGAQGPQGEKGDQGPQGATGSTGAVGAKGDTDVVTILGIMSAACGATTIGMAVVCIIFAKKKQLI